MRYRIAELKEELARVAGESPLMDRFHCGYIQALVDMLDVDLSEENSN